MRASSLESSAESESSAMETGDGNSGQVAAVSSTASFKSPAVGIGEEETNGEKQVNMNYISSNSFQTEDFCFLYIAVQLKMNFTIQQGTKNKRMNVPFWVTT